MSNEDTQRFRQMVRNLPNLDSIPKANRLLQMQGRLKTAATLGVLTIFIGSFLYKQLSDTMPGWFSPTTKKFMAIPDFMSKQVHVYYREVPNKPREY